MLNSSLAQAGKKVAIVEEELTGGTCTNYGCDAKIALDGPFEYFSGLENYKGVCVDEMPRIDWTRLMAYKKRETNNLYLGLEQMFPAVGIDFIRGHGTIAAAHTVRVGEKYLETEYIVIATGQRSARRDIPGKEYLHGSRDFLDLEEMPKRIVFIGAGIISMEFASMAIRLGSSVTILAHGDRALREYPEEYVAKLVKKMEADGVRFMWNETVCGVEKLDDGYRVASKSGLEIDCDYILDATGRVANYENIGLEALGIEASAKGIVVNDHMQTAVPNIYASGDVVCKRVPKLTPTAEFESNYIAGQILGNKEPICYPAVPNLVFTLPRIAQTGVTVAEARKHPECYRVEQFAFGQSMLWLARNEKDIDLTFVVDRESYLVGAAIYGSDAGQWIDYLTLIINQKLRAKELRKTILSFPTGIYGVMTALLPLLVLTGMQIKAVKFRKDGFYTQPFAFGGEEGMEKFDKNIRYRGSLQNYLIDTGDEVILLDTGFTDAVPEEVPDENALGFTGYAISDYVTAFKALGYQPEQVTKIILTHRHNDHSGSIGLFPNAKIYVNADELDAEELKGVDNLVPVKFTDGPYYNFPESQKIMDGVYLVKAKGHTNGNSIVIIEKDGLFYMFHADITYVDEALYENKVSVVYDDLAESRVMLDRVREFVRNHPTVYMGTHTPQGYENLEARRVIDLDNPVPTIYAEVDFSVMQATGKYICSICGYVYDPAEHDGVAFEELPEDWKCPRCKHGKENFNKA